MEPQNPQPHNRRWDDRVEDKSDVLARRFLLFGVLGFIFGAFATFLGFIEFNDWMWISGCVSVACFLIGAVYLFLLDQTLHREIQEEAVTPDEDSPTA